MLNALVASSFDSLLILLLLFLCGFVALRKLEAKRRNMAGKLERLGTIRRDMDSKIYNPLIHCDISTNKNTKRMINSHYLHTYEGLNLNHL